MQKNYQNLPPITGTNFVPLSPVSFLSRTADTYPDHAAVIYGDRSYTWKQTAARCRQLASALQKLGVGVGDTVSIMAANTPELVEAHYGVPMCGGVLNAINTRLDADTVAYILAHSDAKILITDTHFSSVIKHALSQLKKPPTVIDINDTQTDAPDGNGDQLGVMDYEKLLATGDDDNDKNFLPSDEWNAITLNYTSGTSGRPKGVVYHHRGAYLMAMGTIAAWQIPKHPRYLYTEWNAITLNYTRTSGTSGRPKHRRGLSSSRRVFNGDGNHCGVANSEASALSLYRADVPLQRLGTCVDDGGDGRNDCL